MSDACLFCRIVDGDIPATIVYEDDLVVAFEDVNPQAPTHVLVVPRRHIPTINDLGTEDETLAGHLLTTAAAIARERGFDAAGYRTVLNCNAAGGQTVFHIHLHLLGGRNLSWPPG